MAFWDDGWLLECFKPAFCQWLSSNKMQTVLIPDDYKDKRGAHASSCLLHICAAHQKHSICLHSLSSAASCQCWMTMRNRCLQVYATHLREAQANGRSDPPLSVGFCHELCAGIIDKEKSLEEISHEEVQTTAVIPMPEVHWLGCTALDCPAL